MVGFSAATLSLDLMSAPSPICIGGCATAYPFPFSMLYRLADYFRPQLIGGLRKLSKRYGLRPLTYFPLAEQLSENQLGLAPNVRTSLLNSPEKLSGKLPGQTL